MREERAGDHHGKRREDPASRFARRPEHQVCQPGDGFVSEYDQKYLEDGSPPSYKRSSPRPRPQLSGFEDLLEQAYRADLKRPRRDRRTALKLYEFVVGKGYKGSYSPVQRFIRDLQRADGVGANAFVPLQFDAGDAMQFDWSQEYVVLGGVRQKVHVAHFRLCHSRKPFVVAYPGESQEMVLDAFTRALTFFGGVPRRVIIDNPKTMVVYVSRSKDRVFHPRFLALMSHYVMEPAACTPAPGWEKGQVENQVQHVRGQMFAPPPSFDDLDDLNIWLEGQCERLAGRPHPEQRDRKVNDVFADEFGALHPLGRPFDGYVEKTVRVLSTCLVQYDSNRYSVPSDYAGRHVSLRVYANRIVATADQKVVAEHKRRFTRNASYFEPWHYVPLLDRKPPLAHASMRCRAAGRAS